MRSEVKSDDILTENWDGEASLLPLLRDILEREADLIGDQRDKILQYTGCSQVVELKK